MKNVHIALMDFWEQFSLPVFLSGHVPEDQPFPYFTIEIGQADAFSDSVLTAFDWHKIPNPETSNANIMRERAELMDRIAAAIPPQGVKIPLPDGYLVLSRNPADFQTYYDDPEDASVLGGRTSYEIRYYTN